MSSLVPANSAPKPVKKPRLSKKLRQAIDLWLRGKVSYRKDAAIKAGLTPDYFSRAINKPVIRSLIREWAEQNITDATIRASSRVLELLDGGSEHVAGKVALRLLESGKLIAPAGFGTAVQINNFADRHGYELPTVVDWDSSREEDVRAQEQYTRAEASGVLDEAGPGYIIHIKRRLEPPEPDGDT
jgi:hypothetical protein